MLRIRSLADIPAGCRIAPSELAHLVPTQEIGRKAVPSSKRDQEGLEQSEVILLFREAYPEFGHLLIHIPNGGSRRNAFEGWRLKQQGVRAGVSDLFLPIARGGYFGLWIEFKAAPPNDAAVSDSQREWVSEMLSQGYLATIKLGAKAALATLAEYMKLPLTEGGAGSASHQHC